MSVEWSEAAWRRHLPGIDDPAAFVERVGTGTIPGLAQASALAVPDRVAVRIDDEEITHAGLDAGAASVAGWLAGRIEPGDRIVLVGPSSLDFLRCYLGALRAGAIVVLGNPAYTESELGHLVEDSGAKLVLTDLTEPCGEPIPALPIQPDDVALLAYTSGTTGRPKGVPLTHRHLLTSIRSAMAAWRWSADDVLTHALPLFHQHGLSGVHATLAAGSTARLFSRFSAETLASSMREATVLFAVPTMYEQLVDFPDAFDGLRLCVCGSAPLSEKLAARLPRVPLVRYGTTESGLDVSNPYDDPRGDTVGIPLPGVHVRIMDEEIQLRGPQVFSGYWRSPASAFTGDGWFKTGDLGAIVDGHLVIKGRSKELIITGGLNVYPREVETALEQHPAVVEAAVAGVPHDKWGEQVTAWVVLHEPVSLTEHAASLLAPYKRPKQVFEVQSLPRNQMGKIDRKRLTSPLRRAAELGAFVEIESDPPAGIRLAVKDLIDVTGQWVRNGTSGAGHRLAGEDSDAVARLREAGCVPIGRTTVSELAWYLTTPGCVNPWAPDRHAGGSSGGSAVAVACGAARIALGTDTGGSIRVPAALCGVAGLRPTWGAISTKGVTPLAPSMDTVGPIALTAADCLWTYQALGGDGGSAPETVAGLRIGLLRSRAEPSVLAVIDGAAAALRAAGADVVEIDFAQHRARKAAYTILLAESADQWWDKRGAGLSEQTTGLLKAGTEVRDYEEARAIAVEVRAELDDVLHGVSAVLMPTVPETAAPLDAESLAVTYFRFTALASLTGHPALTVPAGLSDGLPVGAQLIGARHSEALLCLLGSVIEQSEAGRSLAEARVNLVYQIPASS